MGLFRKFDADGGGVSVCLGKVLTRGGTSGAAIWVGDLGFVGFNVEKT